MHATLLRNFAVLASQQARVNVMQLVRQLRGAFASLRLGWNIFAWICIVFSLGSGLSQSPFLSYVITLCIQKAHLPALLPSK